MRIARFGQSYFEVIDNRLVALAALRDQAVPLHLLITGMRHLAVPPDEPVTYVVEIEIDPNQAPSYRLERVKST